MGTPEKESLTPEDRCNEALWIAQRVCAGGIKYQPEDMRIILEALVDYKMSFIEGRRG